VISDCGFQISDFVNPQSAIANPQSVLQVQQPHPINVVGLSGLEPLTSRLSGVRSNHLSYRPEEDYQRGRTVAGADNQVTGRKMVCSSGASRRVGHGCTRERFA
jgi:hypothetical protein